MRSGLELAHRVDIHIVGIGTKAALGDFGGFGHCVGLDFVGLHFVVEVFYIDLEHTELRTLERRALRLMFSAFSREVKNEV